MRMSYVACGEHGWEIRHRLRRSAPDISEAFMNKSTVAADLRDRGVSSSAVNFPSGEPMPAAWSGLEARRASDPGRRSETHERPEPARAGTTGVVPGGTDVPGAAVVGSLVGGLQRLSQWAHVRSWRHWAKRRLSSTQVKILELLTARDQGLSITAMARELGITAATVCDCVSALVEKGLLTKTPYACDRRERRVRLTVEGREAAREAALGNPLHKAFECLSAEEQEGLNRLTMKMIYALGVHGELAPSRMCARCTFFRPFGNPDPRTPHHCRQADVPLAASELRLDCPVFEAAEAEAQPALWAALIEGSAKGLATDAALDYGDPNRRPLSDGNAPQSAHGGR